MNQRGVEAKEDRAAAEINVMVRPKREDDPVSVAIEATNEALLDNGLDEDNPNWPPACPKKKRQVSPDDDGASDKNGSN